MGQKIKQFFDRAGKEIKDQGERNQKPLNFIHPCVFFLHSICQTDLRHTTSESVAIVGWASVKQFPSCEGVEGEEVLEKAVAEEEEKSDQKLIGGMTD